MAFDPDFLDAMPNRVEVRRLLTERGQYGRKQYADPVIWPCRIEPQKKRVGQVDSNGFMNWRTVLTTTLIGIYVEPPFGPGDVFSLPRGDYTIVGSEEVSVEEDEDGPHHIEITLNSTK